MRNSASVAFAAHPNSWQSLSEGSYSPLVRRYPDKGYRNANASNLVSQIGRVLEESSMSLVNVVEIAAVGPSHSNQRRWRSRLQSLARLAQMESRQGNPAPGVHDFRIARALLEQIGFADPWRVGIFLESDGGLEVRFQRAGSSDHASVAIADRRLSAIVMHDTRAEFGEFSEVRPTVEWIEARLAA